MEDPELDLPAADLAGCEVELEEWERLRVRDYWEAVIADELGGPPLQGSCAAEPDIDEDVRLQRSERPEARTVLRRIAGTDSSTLLPPDLGEAA